MKSVQLEKVSFGWLLLFVLSAVGQSGLHAETTLSAQEIMQRAARPPHQAETQPNHPDYSYTKRTITDELDAAGRIKGRKEKVYQVFSQAGATSARLLEVNGRPPAQADMKQQADTELSVRQLLGQPKSGSGDNRENFLTPELIARYDFRLLGTAALNNRRAYQIAFQPKTPPHPVQRWIDRLLNQVTGTLWIDAEEFEVARAEIHLRSEVGLLGGVVGCLKKMAYTMIRTRVAEGLWLSSSSSGHFEGRKLLDSMRIKTQSQTGNFRLLPAGGTD